MVFSARYAALLTLTILLAGGSSELHSVALPPADDKKISIEQLVAAHLDSIGTAEARAAARTRVAIGAVKFLTRLGAANNLDGTGAIASESPKLVYIMRFPAPEYPSEQMVFDGQRTATSFLPLGRRSNIALFLDQQNLPLKEGLLCGTLSTSWALLRTDQLQPKLEYKGTSKVDGRQLHKVVYRQRKGSSDLRVTLFFDTATARHARTEYQLQIGARIGLGPNDSTAVQESYYLLTEDFDDFRAVDGLTLPHKYKMQMSVNTSRGGVIWEWTLSVNGISHKESFDDKTFTIK